MSVVLGVRSQKLRAPSRCESASRMEGEDTTSTSGYEVPVKERVYGGSITGPDPQAAASQNTFAWNSRFQEILQEVGKLDVDTDYTKVAVLLAFVMLMLSARECRVGEGGQSQPGSCLLCIDLREGHHFGTGLALGTP